ncbi:15881_t:CDS:2 [Entrophospora sp. SA101]|nr:15881_t:CDS:2 [Entrophospora sp. SA101]CAJ0826191.1 16663_t:CDS:2 [Entrophospora sp. SA101]CAJ0906671.1 7920_t:CDS:2 [Entrophospora sp. SA101]CAJ0916040.1 6988_t:CDS:2 [Entrophospora sp. SA101]
MEVELKQTSEWSNLEENTPISKSNIWNETPRGSEDVTPQVSTKKSRWDETPTHPEAQIRATPAGNLDISIIAKSTTMEKDPKARNKPLSDEEPNAMFPSTGYKTLEPLSGYVPIRTSACKLMATPTPMVGKEDKDESELPEGMQDYEIIS